MKLLCYINVCFSRQDAKYIQQHTVANTKTNINKDIKMSKQNLKDALAQLNTIVEALPEDYSPFGSLFAHPEPEPKTADAIDMDALNDFFHETIGKSNRSLNHSLNKVAMDWKMKNIRTPRGARALIEVAKDCNLNPAEMCDCILVNPRFSKGPIGVAAQELLNSQI